MPAISGFRGRVTFQVPSSAPVNLTATTWRLTWTNELYDGTTSASTENSPFFNFTEWKRGYSTATAQVDGVWDSSITPFRRVHVNNARNSRPGKNDPDGGWPGNEVELDLYLDKDDEASRFSFTALVESWELSSAIRGVASFTLAAKYTGSGGFLPPNFSY